MDVSFTLPDAGRAGAGTIFVDAVASEFLVQVILVNAQRRGRRTARRSQARLHSAAGYLAAFVKE